MSASWRNAIVDMNIAALGPSTLFEFLLECFYVWIVEADEHADTPNAVGLLALAASGHAAAPPRSVMNSRRLMSAPKLRRRHLSGSNEYFDRG